MEDKEVLRALENNCIYDFIAVNYWKLSNEQLKDIALELAFQIGTAKVKKQVIKELKERWDI